MELARIANDRPLADDPVTDDDRGGAQRDLEGGRVFALEVDDDRVSGKACFGKHLRHLVVMACLENHDDLLLLELREEIRKPVRDQPARRAVRAEQDENAVARVAVPGPDGSRRFGQGLARELAHADRNRPIVEIQLSPDLGQLPDDFEEDEPLEDHERSQGHDAGHEQCRHRVNPPVAFARSLSSTFR